MATRKRAREELESPEEMAAADRIERTPKQQKTDSAARAALETNSDTSYVSAAAAVFSESDDTSDNDTAHTDLDIEERDNTELSTSSEEPSSASDDSDSDAEERSPDTSHRQYEDNGTRIHIRAGGRPHITKGVANVGLRDKLRGFLPDMRAANEQLEREREAGTLEKRNMENVEGEASHIEMVRSRLRGHALRNARVV